MTTRRDFLVGGIGATLLAPFAHAQATGAAAAELRGVAQFAEAASYSAARQGVSFLVMRTGVLLSEDYPNGGSPAALNNLFGGSKCFAGTLAAVLVRQRLRSVERVRNRRGRWISRERSRPLMTLDEAAGDTLTSWANDPRKSRVSVRQLLNMTSGVAIGLTPGAAPDAVAALSAPAVEEPGLRFVYDNAPFQAFAELARRKLVQAGLATDPASYLQSAVLDQIGANAVRFRRGGDGLPWFATGVEANARSWAAFGEFVRRNGLWRGRFIASESVMIEQANAAGASAGRFGLGWWLANAPPGPGPDVAGRVSDIWDARGVAPTDTMMAAGVGGQRLFVIPSRRLVIVRQAKPPADLAAAAQGGDDWADATFRSMILRVA
jgi:CubicO group peptidase (beta-lactamase class C family)